MNAATTLIKKENPEALKGKEFLEKLSAISNDFLSPIQSIKDKQIKAMERAKRLGFPNKSQEDWKYYNFDHILNSNFQVYNSKTIAYNEDEIKKFKELISHYIYPESINSLLVTINGAYSKELSNLSAFDNNSFKILNLNDPQELAKEPKSKAIIEKYFAANIETENNMFKAINTAFMQKGFLLDIQEGFSSNQTLQILHISNNNTFNQMRSLIYAGKNSEFNIVVNYAGIENTNYFTNAAIELIIDENAKLKLDKIQNESKSSIQMYNLRAVLNRDSKLDFNSFTFGSLIARDDITVEINGEGAEAKVNGLYVVTDARKSHNKVVINHNVPNSSSDQVFKGLLYDESRGEFNGTVLVREGAQQTNAQQLNKNLLLSNKAHVESRPQLYIYADDVKCSHGSTIGQIEDDQLFYLQSRGLNKADAITTLTFSFCEELIHKISLESARDMLTKLALRNLNKGLISLTDSSVKKQCLN